VTLKGSCMCGKVKYELRGEPIVTYYCHCGKCRKQSGSSFATNVIFRKEHLVFIAGEEAISRWNSSPGKHRYFCSGCGSPLYSHGENRPHIVSVRAGTLSDPLPLAPSVHAFVASRANWVEIADGLPQHPEYFA
jgi:hypothetical protein